MDVQLSAAPAVAAEGDWLLTGLFADAPLEGELAQLNAALGGQIARLQAAGDFTGKIGEIVPVRAATGISAQRLLLLGLGPAEKLTPATLERAFLTATRTISSKATELVSVWIPTGGPSEIPLMQRIQIITTALHVGCVGQDLYRTEKKRFPLVNVRLLVDPAELSAGQAALEKGAVLGEAVNLARELVNRPAQELFPVSFAARAEQLAAAYGLTCEVLDQPALEAERMGALLAVSAGSTQPPRLVMLEHRGGPPDAPVLSLVGKGVTFDSGGLSLKPTDGMLTMKCDMAGAAAVLAAMSAIARLKLPLHVRGYMGLVENMTGGSAMKLGDILKSRAGVTIEVLNTDAEGRLVLADVLDYAVSRGTDYLVDLATLTGACVVALGEDVAGAMTNNQPWCDRVLSAAQQAGEDVWQLPMFEQYAKQIEGDVGDIKNTGGRWGGAITAAKFLERFVHEKPWVHLDIAGPAFASSDKPHREGGGTGCMVRTLVALAEQFPA